MGSTVDIKCMLDTANKLQMLLYKNDIKLLRKTSGRFAEKEKSSFLLRRQDLWQIITFDELDMMVHLCGKVGTVYQQLDVNILKDS